MEDFEIPLKKVSLQRKVKGNAPPNPDKEIKKIGGYEHKRRNGIEGVTGMFGRDLEQKLRVEGFDLKEKKQPYVVQQTLGLEEFCELVTKSKKAKNVLMRMIQSAKDGGAENPTMGALMVFNKGFYGCHFEDERLAENYLRSL